MYSIGQKKYIRFCIFREVDEGDLLDENLYYEKGIEVNFKVLIKGQIHLHL